MKEDMINKRSGEYMHAFSYKGQYFLFDISTTSCFEIDRMTFDIINSLYRRSSIQKELLMPKYSTKEISNVLEELNKLCGEGYFQNSNGDNLSKSYNITGIELNLINACNMNCIYCFGDGGSYGAEDCVMDIDVARRAVDFLIEESKNDEYIRIIYFGGEPLLRFDTIKEISEYAMEKCGKHHKKVRFSITTNGTLLDDSVIEYLNEHNFSVLLSIDGPKDNQDILRPLRNNKSSYDCIVPKVRQFTNSRKKTSVRATITKINMDLKKIIHEFEELGFSECSLIPVESQNEALCLDKKDYESMKDQHAEMAETILERIRNGERVAPILFNNVRRMLQNLYDSVKREYPCGAGIKMVCISPKGDVYLCHRFAENGNYKLGDIYNGIDKNRDTLVKNNYLVSDENCRSCWIKNICGGGCIHTRLDKNSNELMSNYPDAHYCDFLRYTYELAIVIYNELDRRQQQETSMEGKDVEACTTAN